MHRLSPTSQIGLYPGEDIASYTETPTTVIPLIKGHSLDKLVPSNYRPISNLNFISKILERLFLSHFQSYILKYPNFWPTDRSGLCHRKSVCLSVCLSVTLVYCGQTA